MSTVTDTAVTGVLQVQTATGRSGPASSLALLLSLRTRALQVQSILCGSLPQILVSAVLSHPGSSGGHTTSILSKGIMIQGVSAGLLLPHSAANTASLKIQGQGLGTPGQLTFIFLSEFIHRGFLYSPQLYDLSFLSFPCGKTL